MFNLLQRKKSFGYQSGMNQKESLHMKNYGILHWCVLLRLVQKPSMVTFATEQQLMV